ncbi:MAG TPA: hypothetical protein VM536_06370, partial [Chloroflexia bacterium]|nr:hypothetical protein [Chloroflexia bacterium]
SPSRYDRVQRADPAHINLYTPSEMRREVAEAGFVFRRYLNNWPRAVLTRTRVEWFLWRQVCRFARPDWLSGGASCVAVKPAR